MEHVLAIVWTFFGSLKSVQSLDPSLMPKMMLFSALGAVILSRHTGRMTWPANFSVLFMGAVVSNWLLQNVTIAGAAPIITPLLVSMLGMTIASLGLLWARSEPIQT